jgi:hypothetical protein
MTALTVGHDRHVHAQGGAVPFLDTAREMRIDVFHGAGGYTITAVKRLHVTGIRTE